MLNSLVAIITLATITLIINHLKKTTELPLKQDDYSMGFGNVNGENHLCNEMGRWILKNNGSAVDSAITTMICNGIMDPSTMGIGGGFLMTIYDRKNKQAYFLNAKDKAPLAAHKNMFKNQHSESSKIGALAIGVPGEIAGYWEAHKRFGKLDWIELFKPNIKLCERKTVLRPKLCETIKIIANKGGSELYNGTLGEMLIEDLTRRGSIMTIDDLKNYRVKWTDPIINTFSNGSKLYTSNLPGSGGLLVLILNIFEELKFSSSNLKSLNDTIKTYHRMIETWKYAYAIRSQMGDPDFTDMTDLLKNITSKKFAKDIKDKINDEKTWNEASHYGAVDNFPEDHGTSHISVIAPNGDAVAVTSSLNGLYGSEVFSEQTGILLNSAMDDFSISSVVNTYSLPSGNKNNEIVGGKRPLSSMVPSIITTPNGDVRMVIGAAGGTQITTSTSFVIARHLFMGEPIKEAVATPRIHHQLFPMAIAHDRLVPKEILNGLEQLGHNLTQYGGSNVIALVQVNGTIIDHSSYLG